MTGMIAEMDSGPYFLLVVLCLVMLSVSMLRRSQQRRASSRDLTREQLARLRDQKDVRQSMDELLVQLEEVSRRINAQVDTRFAKLETVIRDADERIARLEQLAPRAGRDSVRTGPPATNGGAKPGTSSGPSAPQAGEFQPGLPVARRSTSPTEQAEGPSATPPASNDERRQRIYELADSGTTPMTIADTLQMPLGEVELILSLRRFK